MVTSVFLSNVKLTTEHQNSVKNALKLGIPAKACTSARMAK